ncbi:uncharacterized protein LOC119080865 [Bradysia coprophila]|uniref:uncharacterized protein LOC119080865 n=1 Tax=Bradysia coprophila TaxID=38358 RepID=UPI00187D7FBD|nr:uncharacterized protein LOC119080865 [Bradysia coprophila]
MKNQKKSLIKIAANNRRKMSESDRLKESGRKAFEFPYKVFYGPVSAIPYTFDRDLQHSLLDSIEFVCNTIGNSAKEIARNVEISTILKQLFSTSIILPVGQTANLPDLEDVNVLEAQQKLLLDLTITCANKDYHFSLPIVGYGLSISSGNEVCQEDL